MNGFRISISIASLLLSAFVAWRCFAWYRRFRRVAFLVCGIAVSLAVVYSALITFVVLFRFGPDAMQRQITAWQPSEQPLDQLRSRVEASWNSLVITGVGTSVVLSILFGLYATTRFGREASKLRNLSREQPKVA